MIELLTQELLEEYGEQYPELLQLLELEQNERLMRGMSLVVELGIFPPDFEMSQVAQIAMSISANKNAQALYQCRPYAGPVELFVPEEDAGSPDMDWSAYLSDARIHVVPGAHGTMLAPPHVEVVARKLQAALKRPR